MRGKRIEHPEPELVQVCVVCGGTPTLYRVGGRYFCKAHKEVACSERANYSNTLNRWMTWDHSKKPSRRK